MIATPKKYKHATEIKYKGFVILKLVGDPMRIEITLLFMNIYFRIVQYDRPSYIATVIEKP